MGHVELERDNWLVVWGSEIFVVVCLILILLCLKNKSRLNTTKHHTKEAIY